MYFDTGAWMIGMARKRIRPAELILRMLEAGIPEGEISANHRQLDDIRAARTLTCLAGLDLLDLVYC